MTDPALVRIADHHPLPVRAALSGGVLLALAVVLCRCDQTGWSIQPGGGSGGNRTPSKVAFSLQPSTTSAGALISPPVVVAVQDASGNTVTAAANSVTVALGANPAGGTLAGTLTVGAVHGLATFTDLTIDKAGAGYRLSATSAGLGDATSDSFNVTALVSGLRVRRPGERRSGPRYTRVSLSQFERWIGAAVLSASRGDP